jgi:hypothetical protein
MTHEWAVENGEGRIKIWEALSRKFSQEASGEVHFICPKDLTPGPIYLKIEATALDEGIDTGRITKIIDLRY